MLVRNDYYGGMWASFTFEALQKWLDECRSGKTNVSVKTSSPLVQDDEKSANIGNQFSTVFNIEEKWFIPEYEKYYLFLLIHIVFINHFFFNVENCLLLVIYKVLKIPKPKKLQKKLKMDRLNLKQY